MTKKHAVLSASSSDRWMNCPGSIKLSEGIPNIESVYAREGSAAHAVAETALNTGLDAEDLVDRPIKGFEDIECTDEMAEAVQVYLDTVRLDMQIYADAELDVEMKFDLSHIYPNCFGTNDALIYSPSAKKLTVYDYKHGRGVAVSPKNNSQLMYYAVGALTGKNNRAIETIELVIVQPRCPHEDGSVRRWTLTPLELLDFIADLVDAAERTEVADPLFAAGDWCQFCPAAAICPTLREKSMKIAQADFATDGSVVVSDPSTFTSAQLGKMWSEMDILENYVKRFREYCHAEAMNGRAPDGTKLVDKQARRKWIDENILIGVLKDNGIDEATASNQKLKSPAQMEKLLKENKFAKDRIADIVGNHCEAVSSGTNLVSINSKKPAKISGGEEFL